VREDQWIRVMISSQEWYTHFINLSYLTFDSFIPSYFTFIYSCLTSSYSSTMSSVFKAVLVGGLRNIEMIFVVTSKCNYKVINE
jgi:hypothetical protein